MNIKKPFKGIFKITQLFGQNPQIYKQFGMKAHNGIDFGTPKGTKIITCDDGIVDYILFDKNGYGTHIKIKHKWGESIYAHLDRIFCHEGQKVKRGATIATSDNTGFSTGSHLHFGIRINGKTNKGYYDWLDPMPYFEKPKVYNSKPIRKKKVVNIPDIKLVEPKAFLNPETHHLDHDKIVVGIEDVPKSLWDKIIEYITKLKK